MRPLTPTLTLALSLVLFALLSASPLNASAQNGEIGFGISPVPASDPAITASGYFIYKVQSSTSVTGSVLLKNLGGIPLTIQIAAVDAITAQTGGSAFTTADVTPTGTGTWLRFSETSVTLPAGTQKSVDFTVAVPQGLKPGQYLAGISAYIPNVPVTAVANQGSTSMGANITTQTRYVIGVQLDIQGEWTPSLEVQNVALVQQPSGPFIGVTMKNDGGVFHTPTGTIVMTDTAGMRVLEQTIAMGTFVPNTGVVYPVKWSGVMAPGMYHVYVKLAYGESGLAIYDKPLEISAASVVKPDVSAAQAPAVIGSSNPVTENSQPPSTSAVQAGSDNWLWIAGSAGILLLAILALLARYMAKTRRQGVQSEAL